MQDRSIKNTSILTVCIQKGGAGKTTCAVNLAASYCHLGLKVLFVDLDYQANATKLLGISSSSIEHEKTLCFAIENEMPFSDIITQTNIPNLDLLAGSEKLFALNQNMIGKPQQNFLLHPVFDHEDLAKYDLAIIDTNPNPDALFQSALTISHYYIVPTPAENDVIDGLSIVFKNAETIKKYLNPKLTLLGCSIQKFDKDSPAQVQNEKILRKISKENKMPIFENVIPFSKAVYSASNAHTPLISYLKNSPISKSYLALAGEIKPLLKGGRIGRSQAQIHVEQSRFDQLKEEDEAMIE